MNCYRGITLTLVPGLLICGLLTLAWGDETRKSDNQPAGQQLAGQTPPRAENRQTDRLRRRQEQQRHRHRQRLHHDPGYGNLTSPLGPFHSRH